MHGLGGRLASMVVVFATACGLAGCGSGAQGMTAGGPGDSPSPLATVASSPAPAPSPTRLLDFTECPDYISSGINDYIAGTPAEPWEEQVARYARQGLRQQHPDAVPTVAARTEDGMVVVFVDPGGRRVARLGFAHDSGGWHLANDQMCSTGPNGESRPRHY